MAQINITLNQEEILQLLADNRNEAMKELLRKSFNQILQAESSAQLGADNYERTEERLDYRNGMRERNLTTRIGTITLEVPRHRNQPFHTMLFENYQRSEASLITTMTEMVICGVSTRKVSKVVETLCGKEVSKSQVSEACKQLDIEVEAFRNRPIESGKYPFLMVDATYFKVREDHKTKSMAFMVAVGITGSGEREIIGFDLYENENHDSWLEFIRSLKRRGLSKVIMFTSDSHPSIRYAMAKEYPEVPWQRCQFHLTRNILDETPKNYKAGLEVELREMFHSKTIEEARTRKDEILKDYMDVSEKAMETLDTGFDDAMAVYMLPEEMRVSLRTSNMVERLNGELKRRSDVIKIFPNVASVIRLMGSVAIDYNETLANRRKLFYGTSMEKINEKVREELKEVAANQINMMRVA